MKYSLLIKTLIISLLSLSFISGAYARNPDRHVISKECGRGIFQ